MFCVEVTFRLFRLAAEDKNNKITYFTPLLFFLSLFISRFQVGCSALFPLSSYPLCFGAPPLPVMALIGLTLRLMSRLLSGVSCQCFVSRAERSEMTHQPAAHFQSKRKTLSLTRGLGCSAVQQEIGKKCYTL